MWEWWQFVVSAAQGFATFWDFLPQWLVDVWRLFNAWCSLAACVFTVRRLWHYRAHWTFQEKHFMRGGGLYAFTAFVGSFETLLLHTEPGWRLPLLGIANAHIIYATLGRPSRLEQFHQVRGAEPE